MEHKLDMISLREDVKKHLGLEIESYNYTISDYNSFTTTVINYRGVITYDDRKSIKGKSFINDINAGFCSPGYVFFNGGGSVSFLENFRAIVSTNYGYTSDLKLTICCLVEGGVENNHKFSPTAYNDHPNIVMKKELLLEGQEYKLYTLFTMYITCNSPTIENRELVLKDRGWLDYISLVFQECVKRHIENIK